METGVNQLSFRRYAYTSVQKRRISNRWRSAPPNTIDLIVPLVDGVPFGRVVGLDGVTGMPARFVEPRAVQWLGPATYTDDDGRAAIIDGSCGIAACCGILAMISFDASFVTWSDFRFGPNGLDRPQPLVCRFDRAQYESAVHQASALEPVALVERF